MENKTQTKQASIRTSNGPNETKGGLLVIHHHPCDDGLTAAWAVKRAHPDAELHQGIYGQPPPDVTGRDVVLVDFTYRRDVLLDMVAKARSLLILDHHKTAQEDLAGLDDPTAWYAGKLRIVFDMDRSGAGIAWDHYHSHYTRPWLIDTIEDNDLWRFALPDTKALIEAIRSFPPGIDTIENLSAIEEGSGAFQGLLGDGAALLRYKDILVAKSVEFATQVKLDHVPDPVWAANVPYYLCSEVANALAHKNADEFRQPIGVTYYRRADGLWALSFRSIGSTDVGEVAKRYGGGGHRNSSGANVERIPWEPRWCPTCYQDTTGMVWENGQGCPLCGWPVPNKQSTTTRNGEIRPVARDAGGAVFE